MGVFRVLIGVIVLVSVSPQARAVDRDAVKSAIDRGLWFLREAQLENGSWDHYPGITALCLSAFTRSPRAYREKDGPFIRRPAKFLLGFQDESGAFVPPDGGLKAYNTGVVMMALASLENATYEPAIRRAQEYLVKIQADETEGYESGDIFYGGIGYGSDLRPDLSNLQMSLEALKVTDHPANSEVWTKAICFLERCQNLPAYNDQEGVGDDGGFVYYPGFSNAEATEEGGLRSYGSMTYAGLKSYIYCGLERDDPRVRAALDWIRRHYTVEENPGLGAAGLYYYLVLFSRTFSVLDLETLDMGDGVERDWFDDLAGYLLRNQKEDGSWVNTGSGRWWENSPSLCTAYAILALSEGYRATGK